MLRINCQIHMMVGAEVEAEALEKILKDGPLVLLAPDEVLQDGGFFVVILDANEVHGRAAELILGSGRSSNIEGG